MNKNEKKIAIFTYWSSSDNYGQLLQAFALQTVLKQMGMKPFFVNYKPSFIADLKTKKKSVFKIFDLARVQNFLGNKISKLFYSKMFRREFDSFRHNYISLSKEQYRTLTDLKSSPPDADYYICGSDQIWKNTGSLEKLEVYLLNIPTNAVKIAYAASFGKKYEELDEGTVKIFTENLPKFKAVSVREKSGVEACVKLGYSNAVWLPDPTLLLTKIDYENFFKINNTPSIWKTNKKRILIYTVDNKANVFKSEAVKYIKKQKEYEVVHISSQRDNSGDFFPTIEGWIRCMQQADFILTNSFHGTVFSVIFNKEFAVLPSEGKHIGMNERVFSLLEKTNQSHKVLYEIKRIKELLLDKSDWSFVENKLAIWREEAKSFLKNHIKSE